MKLRVWWIPQAPMKAFYVPVNDVKEARLILDAFAMYDLFQLENRIKPDYSNAGGVEMYDEEVKEWTSWYDEETGNDFDEFCEENGSKFDRVQEITLANNPVTVREKT